MLLTTKPSQKALCTSLKYKYMAINKKNQIIVIPKKENVNFGLQLPLLSLLEFFIPLIGSEGKEMSNGHDIEDWKEHT